MLEDCTGCNLCVEVCPAINPADRSRKAINMEEKEPILEKEKENIRFFENITWNDRSSIDFSTVHGAQFLEPLFEFSGACAGCGETPYLKLLVTIIWRQAAGGQCYRLFFHLWWQSSHHTMGEK